MAARLPFRKTVAAGLVASAGLGIALTLALATRSAAQTPPSTNGTAQAALPQTQPAPVSADRPPAFAPLGDIPGTPLTPAQESGQNRMPPLDRNAVVKGEQLFGKMNCAGCHAYGGKGAMGPDLTDPYWRYGSSPEAIYSSIAEGRPQGMPSWGRTLSPKEIWSLVAYIRSLSKQPPFTAEAPKSGGTSAGQAEGQGLGRH